MTSRAKANTARTRPSPPALLDPTSRRATSSTAYSDRWLTSDHTVIEIHRWETRSMVRLRNLTVASLNRTPAPADHAQQPRGDPAGQQPCSARLLLAAQHQCEHHDGGHQPGDADHSRQHLTPAGTALQQHQGQGQHRHAKLDEAVRTPETRDRRSSGTARAPRTPASSRSMPIPMADQWHGGPPRWSPGSSPYTRQNPSPGVTPSTPTHRCSGSRPPAAPGWPAPARSWRRSRLHVWARSILVNR